MYEILQLGDPELCRKTETITDFSDVSLSKEAAVLYKALENFIKEHGFGRAIASNQLGIRKSMIAINLPGWPKILYNPEILWQSGETITMWDDCMSFPSLLVKVQRVKSVSIRYQDENGQEHIREKLDTPVSELLQHETDHLQGLTAVDRAIDKQSLVFRGAFEKNRDYFRALVTYGP